MICQNIEEAYFPDKYTLHGQKVAVVQLVVVSFSAIPITNCSIKSSNTISYDLFLLLFYLFSK